MSGYLAATSFVEGALVEAGELLFAIDPRPFEAELAGAEAALEEAGARVRSAESRVTAARAQVVSAKTALDLAATRLAAGEIAHRANAMTREQFDERTSAVEQGRAAVAAAEASVAAALADVETDRAAEETARTNVERARLDLGYTRIAAPISGRVGRRLVTRGNLVQGGAFGSTLLTTIVSLDPIHVYVDADEQAYLKYARQAREGARPSARMAKVPLYLALIDETGFPHRGYVDFVDNRMDAETGTMRARGILRNPDLTLTPGLFADVRIPGSVRTETVLVPESAIGADQARRFVWTVDESGNPSQREVELGPLSHGMRVVRSGLDGSESIVVRGLQRIRPGVVLAPALEELPVPDDDQGLPNDYEPVPPDQWIELPQRAGASSGGR